MPYPILQCDGTTHIYNERPWWLNSGPEKQDYRPYRGKITKADKISISMAQIKELNSHKRAERLLDRGVVVRQNENGVVVIRNVAQKLERE
jgi:hypothetical protein